MFSGCGGFRSAADLAGIKTVSYCEIDKWATKFYKNAFNTEGEIYFNDATKINTRELPNFNILFAGFPCQAFSIAGKRRGFEDSRGTMFFEVARILNDKRPRYFVLENVKGLLNHQYGKTFQAILEILTDIGIYTVEWAVLNSKHFGAPQNRERVFIVGYPREYGAGKIFPLGEPNAICSQPREVKEEIHNIAQTIKARDHRSWEGNYLQVNNPYIIQLGRGKNQGGIKTDCPTITKNQWEYNNVLYEVKAVLTPDRATKRQNGRRIKDNEEAMFTLTGQDRHGVMITSANSQGYEVAEEGDSINLSFPNSPTRRGRVGKGYAQTLQTSGNMAVYTKSMIRRLTPLECFRLQGISDAQLYKMAGNSVTVNVVYEIVKKITDLEKENDKQNI